MARHFGQHVMVGAGGAVRIPRSETKELERAINIVDGLRAHARSTFEKGELSRVEAILQRLHEQATEGYHRNPAPFEGQSFTAGKAIGKIGDDVHSIRYRHAKDHKHYQHDFNGDVIVYAVERNGKRDLLLTHREGSPLWDEF